ncbi:amidohydrolase family protein [candidate division KSB1 bacterium]|nr:amidohydrolase family protein [candidate division KSB1 bacterium]
MAPKIDIHAHIFNAKDIPIKGYLQSRKDKDKRINKIQKCLIPDIVKCIKWQMDHPGKKKLKCKLLMIAVKYMEKFAPQWIDTLVKSVPDIQKQLVQTFKAHDIDLYIPLVLDYAYWFIFTQEKPLKEQIELVAEQIVIPGQGKIHPFVPFDPDRELAKRHNKKDPGDKPETFGSLSLVKDAIENKGFIGVKLYNAMGYAPLGNADPEFVKKRENNIYFHDSRYKFDGEKYDQVLMELYDYCIENDVPITTHCGMDGVESFPDASEVFGVAKLWEKVLDIPKYSNLRLNLAHFGWKYDKDWKDPDGWVEDICKMMDKYKNLYTDLALYRIFSSGPRKKFINSISKMCAEYPVVKQRMMYGTDWHVSKRAQNFNKVFSDFKSALSSEKVGFTQAELDAFFGGNAFKFLGLEPGEKNHRRLKQFYQKKGIQPPDWFKE